MTERFSHAVVDDLAWAIGSPPLMLPHATTCRWYDSDWYRRLREDSESWLRQLDSRPEQLIAAVESEKDKRLGKYFEALWAYWFEHSGYYDVIARNMQIHDAGRTLGELDCIVRDRQTGKVIHIELVIKFYLGVGDTAQQCNWHGPGKQDRLDMKMNVLQKKQSILARHERVAGRLSQQGIEVDECAVIMKGRLFYPEGESVRQDEPDGANPQHQKSRWLKLGDFLASDSEYFYPLIRSGWMVEQPSIGDDDWLPADRFTRALSAGDFRLPLQLVSRGKDKKNKRFFVVPDEW